MKYFFDTEFIEGFRKPLFGKRSHFIDLISIGIVSETGKQLYFVSNEYSYKDADDWVKENVILPLYISMVHGEQRNRLTVKNFHKVLGISNKEIAEQVAIFCECFRDQLYWRTNKETEFYAYYADYDWVVFCSLFGRMIDLPKGFPMYCKDLKQMMDETLQSCNKTVKYKLEFIKKYHSGYPKQENEHTALGDAKWNFKLFEFVKKCRV